MPPQPPPSSIRLRIKVPPGHIEGAADEFAFGNEVPVKTKIGQLREQLQHIIPTNPQPDRQRLLYGGRALVDNEQTLGDALNIQRDPSQSEYVVHLLIRSDSPSVMPASHLRPAQVPGAPANMAPQQQQQQQQQQDGTAPGPAQQQQGHRNRYPLPNEQLHELARQEHARFMIANEQRRLIMQNAMQNGHNATGLLPFPMQPVNVGGHMHLPQQHVGHPAPHHFHQVVAQGQQNRAAMGLQGLGGPQQGTQQHGAPESNTPQSAVSGENQARGTSPLAASATPGNEPSSTQARSQSQPNASSALNGAPHQPLPPPRRPVSNQGFHVEGINQDGSRFSVTHQSINIGGFQPQQAQPHGQVPLHMPNFLQPPGFPARSTQPPPPSGPVNTNATGASALDRARGNLRQIDDIISRIRRSLAHAVNQDQVADLERLEQSARALRNYIDPFGLGDVGNNAARPSFPPPPNFGSQAPNLPSLQSLNLPPYVGAATIPQALHHPAMPMPMNLTLHGNNMPGQQPFSLPVPHNPTYTHQASLQAASANVTDVTCYLLSSPHGPEAILYSPQHGMYTGRHQPHEAFATTTAPPSGLPPVPTRTTPGNENAVAPPAIPGLPNAAPGQQAPAQNPAQQQLQRQAVGQQNGQNLLQPIMGHFWLLFRILIFGYFFLGANLGWRRPLILVVIGVGFWLVRLGLFGEGGVLRRWWDGIVGVPRGPDPRRPGDGEGQVRAAQPPGDRQQLAEVPAVNGNRPGAMPTPEQVAQRLLNQQRQAQNARVSRLREWIRPLERTVALLVASLWPGVGEGYVRALEAEERRRAEEEVARQRREEEEKQKKEAEEQAERAGEDENAGEAKADVETEAETASRAVGSGTQPLEQSSELDSMVEAGPAA